MSYDQILIDGNFFARRMFSVHKRLKATVDGNVVPTGLTHGFLLQLCQLKRYYEGTIVVVWDKGIKRRRAIDRDYKRKRRETEWDEQELFLEHSEILRYFLKLICVRQAWKQGEEGDDVLHTLAKRHKGFTLIASNDHDMIQAVTETTHLLVSKKGNDSIVWTPKKVLKAYGVTPEGYEHSMCLSGCTGDQVAGVQGVGTKTALEFCSRWPMLVPVLMGYGVEEGWELGDWLPEVKSGKVVEKTKAFKEGEKGPNKRLMTVLESAAVVETTHRLVQLYDVWPVAFVKPGEFDEELVEETLERCELFELAERIDVLKELSE